MADEGDEHLELVGDFFNFTTSNSQDDSNAKKSVDDLKLCWFGPVTEETKQDAEIYFSVLKPFRVKCFQVALDLLRHAEVHYFIGYGTLLSVFRDSGVMIKHDHDTDLLIDEKDYTKLVKQKHLLPEGYKMTTTCAETCFQWMRTKRQDVKYDAENPQGNYKMLRVIDTRDYSSVLEECQIKEGLTNPYTLFHRDIFTDFYTYRDSGEYIFENMTGFGMSGKTPYSKNKIFPTKTQIFEGVECQAPNDPEYVLSLNYGYLGRDFYFDEKTFMYKKIGT